jgi:hypothetical protein
MIKEVFPPNSHGSVSAQSSVHYNDPDAPENPEDPDNPGPPSMEIFSPLPDSYFSRDTVQVSGLVTRDADISSVIVNGQPATLTGSAKRSFTAR